MTKPVGVPGQQYCATVVWTDHIQLTIHIRGAVAKAVGKAGHLLIKSVNVREKHLDIKENVLV